MVFQLGSMLDAFVVAILDKQDAYGYSMTQKLKDLMDISESTLYPVLRRLQKEGLLTTYDSQYQGRNRRYYQITENGRQQLTQYKTEWAQFKEKVDSIFAGGTADE